MKACLMQISSMPQASRPFKVEMYPIFAGYEPNHKCANGILDGKNFSRNFRPGPMNHRL